VDRSEGLDWLPKPYGMALRLRDAGASDDAIGRATGVPTDAVATLIEVGDHKLAQLLDDRSSSVLGM
jgi:hypothetical protein